jgi:TRAP-type C4-dicarboxylate transport system permease small subunit
MNLRNRVDRAVRFLLVVLMSAIVIDVLMQVFSRYLFGAPLGFTDELASFLLIWLGLLGSAYATGEKQHLAIDLLAMRVSPTRQRRLEVIVTALVVVFALTVLIVGGSWLVYTSFLFGQRSASLQLPLGYVYLILPIAGGLIAYYSLDNTFRPSPVSTEPPLPAD